MGNGKKSGIVWKIVGIVLAVAGLCLVAVKVYQKFFKKKKEELAEAEEVLEIEGAEAEEAAEETETFEAPAEAVIANAEELVEEAN